MLIIPDGPQSIVTLNEPIRLRSAEKPLPAIFVLVPAQVVDALTREQIPEIDLTMEMSCG